MHFLDTDNAIPYCTIGRLTAKKAYNSIRLFKQDACRGVHSACRREVNRRKLDICVPRLRQGQIQAFSYVGQNFLVLKWGGGLD